MKSCGFVESGPKTIWVIFDADLDLGPEFLNLDLDYMHWVCFFHQVASQFSIEILQISLVLLANYFVYQLYLCARDFMELTMEKTNYILHYLLPLIGKASPALRSFLEE